MGFEFWGFHCVFSKKVLNLRCRLKITQRSA